MNTEIKCGDFKEATVTGKAFVIPHPGFCDLYLTCEPNTDLSGVPYQGQMGICDEGQGFDSIEGHTCENVDEITCSDRERFHNLKTRAIYFARRPAAARNIFSVAVAVPNYSDYCLELNGLFEVPNECPKYVECHHGKVNS